MTLDPTNFPKICNVIGLSMCLAGGFLLSIEAIRLKLWAGSIEKLKRIAETIDDPMGLRKRKPLPFTWPFALFCLVFCVVSWVWAPFLIIWTLTPALFVILFLFHRILTWSIAHSDDGIAAIVGFILLTFGTGFQLAGTVLG